MPVCTKYKQTVDPIASHQMASQSPTHIPSRQEYHRQTIGHAAGSGRPRRPAIPDLRFEYSYLRSVQSYISAPSLSAPLNFPRASSATDDVDHREGTQIESEKVTFVDSGGSDKNGVLESLYGVPLDIRWHGIAWVTARDQVRGGSNYDR